MRAFAKAVSYGTLAGAWLPLIFTVIATLISTPDGINGSGNLRSSLLFALFPLGLSLALVLPASVFVGLPLTALLSRLRLESSIAYVATGFVVGFALPLAILSYLDAELGWWLALLGAFSGAVTGKTWWVEAREANVG